MNHEDKKRPFAIMKTLFQCLALFSGLGLSALPASAQWITQPLLLKPGWNPVHLHVRPAKPLCDEAFLGYPAIESVWKFNRRMTTVEFSENPSTLLPPSEHWLVWLPLSNPQSFIRNLNQLEGDQSYLIKVATNAAPFYWIVQGMPFFRTPDWLPNALNLFAYPINPEAPPTFAQFFADMSQVNTQPGINSGIYSIGSNGREVQIIQTTRLQPQPGVAYWIKCGQFTRLILPLTFQGDFAANWLMDFGRDGKETSIYLKNVTASTTITLTVKPRSSEPAPSGTPDVAGDVPLSFFVSDPSQGLFGWMDLPPVMVVSLAPGEEKELRFAVRRSAMQPYAPIGTNGAAYQSFLDVAESPHGVRVLLPVSAENDFVQRAKSAKSSGDLPQYNLYQGLWVGQATISAVNRIAQETSLTGDAATPLPTAQKMSFRLLVHVDAQGQARLLQRVLLAIQGSGTNAQYNLFTDETKVPATTGEVYRVSSVAFPAIPPVLLDGTMGYALMGRVNLDYDDPVNPFKHRYHPDHDNLDEQFSTNKLAAGKESYNVARDVLLNFYVTQQDESGQFRPPGAVLQFNGTNAYVTADPVTFSTGAFTVMAWIKTDGLPATNAQVFNLSSGSSNSVLLKFEGTNGQMTFACTAGGNTSRVTTTNAFPTNQWTHVTVVNDGNGTGRIYWNAVLVAQGSLSAVTTKSLTNVVFGRAGSSSTGYFAGKIYDIVFWGDVRTAEEVYGDMYLSYGSDDDNMLAYYRAVEGQGNLLQDATANNQPAQTHAVTWNTTEAMPMPFWGIGEASGEYSETIYGLRRVPIKILGVFKLQRINRNSTLN